MIKLFDKEKIWFFVILQLSILITFITSFFVNPLFEGPHRLSVLIFKELSKRLVLFFCRCRSWQRKCIIDFSFELSTTFLNFFEVIDYPPSHGWLIYRRIARLFFYFLFVKFRVSVDGFVLSISYILQVLKTYSYFAPLIVDANLVWRKIFPPNCLYRSPNCLPYWQKFL